MVYSFLYNCPKNKTPIIEEFLFSNKKYYVFFAYKSLLLISDNTVLDEFFMDDDNDEIVDFNIKNKGVKISILIKKVSSDHGKINIFEERSYDLDFELEDPISKKYSSRIVNRANEDISEKYILMNNHFICIDSNNKTVIYDLNKGSNYEDQLNDNLKKITYVDQYYSNKNKDSIFFINKEYLTYISLSNTNDSMVQSLNDSFKVDNIEEVKMHGNGDKALIALLSINNLKVQDNDLNQESSVLKVFLVEFNFNNERLFDIKYSVEKKLRFLNKFQSLSFKDKRFSVLLNLERKEGFVEYQKLIYGKFDKNVRFLI